MGEKLITKDLSAGAKALLVSIDGARIDESLLPPDLITKPTAGPHAGGRAFFLTDGKRRVRLTLDQRSPLQVIPDGNGVKAVLNGDVIFRGYIERPLCHCPRQAYITVSERCIFDCKFCPVPILAGDIKSLEEVIALVESAVESGECQAISLTSGIAESPEKEVEYIVRIIRELSRLYDIPIGVSIYPTATSSEDIRSAGACEIKYNVETMNREIFRRVCPKLSLDNILDALEKAVEIFGKNHVSSNFIIGLGEDDACVEQGIEILASMGVIPNLRPAYPHPLREGQITIDRPSPSRLLRLARINKAVIERHGLSVLEAKTMCLPCTGCDLIPHRDL